MFHRPLLIAVLVGLAVAVSPAHGDGLPVPVEDAGQEGVGVPGGAFRYVALHAARNTVVARVDRDGGRVWRSALLRGTFTVPAVALDGTASGLSADGQTLVLIRPRPSFPRRETVLAVLDAERVRLRDVVTLRGDFSFDAISPDGTLMYLVQYTSRTDPTRYVVRAYDLVEGRLLRDPVVDRREPGEQMRGLPLTRVSSRDGRWAYTLYDGNGEHPFVHALDTRERRAVCIDLHSLAARPDLAELDLRLSPKSGELAVVALEGPLVTVDTRTFRVSRPEPEARRPEQRPDAGRDATLWPTLAVLGAGLLLVAGARRRAASCRTSAM